MKISDINISDEKVEKLKEAASFLEKFAPHLLNDFEHESKARFEFLGMSVELHNVYSCVSLDIKPTISTSRNDLHIHAALFKDNPLWKTGTYPKEVRCTIHCLLVRFVKMLEAVKAINDEVRMW